MLTTWLLSLGVFTLLYVGFVVQRYALSYLREQLEAVGEVGGGTCLRPVPQNGGYMIAAYVLVGVILVGYALSLYLRARRSLRA